MFQKFKQIVNSKDFKVDFMLDTCRIATTSCKALINLGINISLVVTLTYTSLSMPIGGREVDNGYLREN